MLCFVTGAEARGNYFPSNQTLVYAYFRDGIIINHFKKSNEKRRAKENWPQCNRNV